jgi:hypothetical protein
VDRSGRRLGVRWLTAAFIVLGLVGCHLPLSTEVAVLAATESYRAQPELEQTWLGILRPEGRQGYFPPSWIGGIAYSLTTDEGVLYLDTGYQERGREIVPALEPLLGRRVEVTGKLVAIELEPRRWLRVGRVRLVI